MRVFLLAWLWVSTAAAAETVSVYVLPSAGAPSLEDSARRALAQLSSLALRPMRPPSQHCAEPMCFLEVGKASESDQLLAIELQPGKQNQWTLVGRWIDVRAQSVSPRLERAGRGQSLDAAVTSLVEQLVPPFARKGFAGVWLQGTEGILVRVDGKTVSDWGTGQLAVSAGAHWVDVVLDERQSVLHPVVLAEGSRQVLEVAGPAQQAGRKSSSSMVRGASYVLWSAGALAIAGSLLSAAASRQASAPLAPCEGADRNCLTLAQAQTQQKHAESYATTANLLFTSGVAMGAVGVGLFTFDLAVEGWK